MLDAALRCAAGGDQNFVVELEFSLRPGRTLCLFGPSGSGKTTTLRALAGLIPCTGALLVHDRDWLGLATEKRSVAMVFEKSALFPGLTAEQNVRYMLGERNDERLAQLLERFAIADFAGRPVDELSFGQRSRVELARAFARGAELVLLDEPFLGLDARTRKQVMAAVEAERDTRDFMIVIVTHSVAAAMRLADEVIQLEGGRELCRGRPAEVFVVRTVASSLEMPGEVTALDAATGVVTFAVGPHLYSVRVGAELMSGVKIGDSVQALFAPQGLNVPQSE